MIGNTCLYVAPKTHPTPLMGGCHTMSGWATDLTNWLTGTAKSAVDVWSTYTGAKTAQEIAQAQATAAAQQAASTQKLITAAAIIGVGVLAFSVLRRG